MHFKLEYTIREFSLPQDEAMTIEVRNTHNVEVSIRTPNKDEQEQGHQTQHAFCDAYLELGVSEKNLEVFEEIEENKILQPNSHWTQQYKGQDGKEISLPSIDEFPEHFKSFLNHVQKELSDSSKMVISALRWRANKLGPHDPISTRGMSWSKDNTFWHPAPSKLSARLSVISSATRLTGDAKKDIVDLVTKQYQEPVYHELFREAWGQRNNNPRSSLVTGISSLEVAIKSTIGTLIPGASWLSENMPSPPIIRLLNEYLPLLPVRNKINNKVLPPPKETVDLIKKGVTIRNQITHIGGKAPADDTLDGILEATRDTMWLLDYYCGHSWAYQFISEETRQKLEIL